MAIVQQNYTKPGQSVLKKRRLPLWAKILIGVGVAAGLAAFAYIALIVFVLSMLGSANTEYNTIVINEAARIKLPLLAGGCAGVSGGETGKGNLDANEEFVFYYACSPVLSDVDQLVSQKLTTLGYASDGPGYFTNTCCRVRYATSSDGYSIDLVDKNVPKADK